MLKCHYWSLSPSWGLKKIFSTFLIRTSMQNFGKKKIVLNFEMIILLLPMKDKRSWEIEEWKKEFGRKLPVVLSPGIFSRRKPQTLWTRGLIELLGRTVCLSHTVCPTWEWPFVPVLLTLTCSISTLEVSETLREEM